MLQLSFECPAEVADALAELLPAAGALAVTMVDAGDDALYERPPGRTPLWPSTRVCGLFAADTDSGDVLERLRAGIAPSALPPARLTAIDDKPWELEYRRAFKPRCFAGRLWIVPSWAPAPNLATGQTSMVVDPGLAFGTGTHPTTRLCLEWLARVDVRERLVVDYGCGSGILAIAAVKLGAARALAVDVDPQALEATAANAARNGVAARVTALAPGEADAEVADALVANILARPLVELAPTLASLLRPGGAIALSGLLDDQADGVAQAVAPWLDLVERRHAQEWALLAGTRRQRAA